MVVENSANNVVVEKSHVKPLTAFMHTAGILIRRMFGNVSDSQCSLTVMNQISVNGAYGLAFKNAAHTPEHSI